MARQRDKIRKLIVYPRVKECGVAQTPHKWLTIIKLYRLDYSADNILTYSSRAN